MISAHDRLRNMVAARPGLVAAIKRVYRSPTVASLPMVQRWVLGRAAKLDANLGPVPTGVTLETVVTCNARCKMCVHGQKVITGEMSMPLFERLVGETRDMGHTRIGLSVYGEPFADRRLFERIQIVRAAGMEYGFFSNGSLMREPVVDRLIELGGWASVNFSVNGYSKSAYEAVMPPLKRDRTYQNIDYLLRRKQKEGGVGFPEITVSCVRVKDNEHEIGEFKRYWQGQDGIKTVIIADCGTWLDTLDEEARASGPTTRFVGQDTWLMPCPSVWGPLTVYCDGRVAPCCEDSALRELIVGDANTQTLLEIHRGQAMMDLRRQHLQNRRSEHEICGRCGWNQPWF